MSECACEVDVNNAGEGELAIMVNKGTVANSVRMITGGVYHVSFVPKEPKSHSVDIKFNSTPLPSETIQSILSSVVCLLADSLAE